MINSVRFRPAYAFFFGLFIADFCVLTYIGGAPIEHPYYMIGQVATAYYFIYFLLIIPFLSRWDNKISHWDTRKEEFNKRMEVRAEKYHDNKYFQDKWDRENKGKDRRIKVVVFDPPFFYFFS